MAVAPRSDSRAPPSDPLDRLRRLQRITSALVDAATPDAIARVLTERALAESGARGSNLARIEGAQLRVVAQSPRAASDRAAPGAIRLSDLTPDCEAARTGEAIWLGSGAEIDARYPHLSSARREAGDEAWAALPLRVGGAVTGVVAFTFDAPKRFDEGDRDFYLAITNQCALALERLRLLEDEQRRLADLAAERDTLARFFEHAPIPICILQGEDLVFRLANAAYREMIGRGQLVGRPLLQALPELRGQGIDTVLRRVLESGERHLGREVPVGLLRGDSIEERFFNLSYEPMRSAGSKVDSVMSTARDITEDVRARRALEFERSRWEQTVEQMPSGLVIADAATGRTVFANRSAQDLWGAAIRSAPHESSRWVAYDLEGREVAPEQFPIPRALRGETVAGCRMRFELPGQVSAITRSNTAPIRDAEGRVIAAVSVFDDVTESWKAEKQRAELLESLRIESEFRERVLAIVGHDLRNPLGAILFGAELLLREGGLGERQERTARRIRDSGDRMKRMISGLLDYAVARQSGTIPIHRTRVDLRTLLGDTVDELEQTSRGLNRIELRADGESWGLWDPDRISEVFSNLIGNALQHGDRARPIRVTLREEPAGTVAVEVFNHGPPIPSEALPTLFDPFRRASSSRSDEGSVGLGLYIARQIVLAHGGALEVASSADAGTRFTVRMPREG